MQEQLNHHVLNVFIGSPGDLSGERAAIKETISELNETIGRTINWHIELFGWEDVVYWLDAILYAPDPIRQSFERTLSAKLVR